MINLQEIKNELDNCPYGMKSSVVKRYAEQYDISEKTLYRKIKSRYGSKRKKRESSSTISEEYIWEVAKIKEIGRSRGAKEREISTARAIKILERRGIVPVGMLSVSTVNTRLQIRGMRDIKPVVRFRAEYANQAHFVDWSRSEYITVAGYTDDQFLLKTADKSLRYKNKEGQAFSLWVSGLRDDYSGIKLHKYYMTSGENDSVGLDFLQWCWSRPQDEHPLCYPPDYLHIDNGAVGKSQAFKNAMDSIGIQIRHSKPYNKQANAKIEREWSTLWKSFELVLMAEHDKGYTFTLDELNEMVFEFCLEEMEKKHTIQPGSRRVVYERSLLAHPPREFEIGLEHLAYWSSRRKVRMDLTFSYKNQLFQAPERYINKYVVISENKTGNIICRGEDDGKIFELSGFQPQPYGEYKRFPDTYAERALKEAQAEESNRLQMKPQPQKIDVKSDFIRPETEPQIFSLDEAKIFIVRQLSLDNYNEVAHLFDDLLAVRTDKEAIDQVVNLIKTKTNVG